MIKFLNELLLNMHFDDKHWTESYETHGKYPPGRELVNGRFPKFIKTFVDSKMLTA